jgi:tetratricopeptide (TPR) repeat protein
MQKGKWAEAESLLSSALRATQEDESVLFRYAVALWMQGNEQQALIHLTKSIARNYSHPTNFLYCEIEFRPALNLLLKRRAVVRRVLLQGRLARPHPDNQSRRGDALIRFGHFAVQFR